MRLIRIFNFSVLALFLALWLVLLLQRESYQGDGLIHPEGVCVDSVFFSRHQPAGFVYRKAYYGLTRHQKGIGEEYTGLWKLDYRQQKVSYFPFPASHRFDSLLAISASQDTSVLLLGMRSDSMLCLIRFDSLIHPGLVFSAPAKVCAFHVMKGRPEIVFGRQGKMVGSVASIGDTSLSVRKYELPGFFDRICEIVVAYPEKEKWRFLLRTDYYRRKDKWILMDTSRLTNFLIFDERAVYPDYPGRVKRNKKAFLSSFDYSGGGLLPSFRIADSLFRLNGNRISKHPYFKGRGESISWVRISGTSSALQQASWDGPESKSGFLVQNMWAGAPAANMPYLVDSGKYVFHLPGKAERRQIFLGQGEQPVGLFEIGKDTLLLLTNRLNYAFLGKNGKLLDRKTFLSLVNSTLFKKLPATVFFLDTELPSVRAMVWLALLYGLLPFWLLSLVIIWLVEAIRNKPKFAVRERPWSFAMRLMPGSLIYFLLYVFNVYAFLSSFSISIF